MKKRLIALAALLAVTITAVLLTGETQEPGAVDRGNPVDGNNLKDRRGALVDEIVFTQETDVGKVAGLIERGSHHVFAQGITNTPVFQRLRDSKRTGYEEAYGSSSELTLNPAGPEFDNGELNPFHVPAIREALNWLVNRRHVAQEIYGGMASPRVLPLNTAFPDYARLAAAARALELHYGHNPERAQKVIREEMRALGATLDNGHWHYKGEPVRLIVLIRTEDARKQVGDYIANLLEDTGFRVLRRYRTAQEASRIWIAGDPAAGRWHIYTGGWISTVINRDESENLSYYYTPRGRSEPLWQAYAPVPELDEISERLQRRDYATWEERQQLMARGLELAMADSARVWLVDQINITPRAADVELAADMAGGISGSWLWPYTVRFRDRVGGRMVFAVPGLLTEPWNPVAGSNWMFDVMITRALDDSPLLPDPFTGLFWPQRIERAEVQVRKGVSVERTHDWLSVETADDIPVPPETWIDWDGDSERFVTVAEKHPGGITARTRTRVYYEADYLRHQWHDGTSFSLADVVLPWILTFARAEEGSELFDPSYLPTFEVFQRHFRGWRILSRDPLVIDIYSDQIYPDAEAIVAARAPTARPWHTLAPAMLAEQSGELAFSSNKADRLDADWLSMVAGPSLSVLARHLEAARERHYVPYKAQLGELIGEKEASERYTALAQWYRQRGHFWVGSGPFYLHSVHAVEQAVVLRRYEDFPDPADKWLRFVQPKIPELNLDGPMMIAVDRNRPHTFELDITHQGEPYPREDLAAVNYLLFDGDGVLAQRGQARPGNNGRWFIKLTPDQLAALGTGANSLEVAVTSRRVALPSFASHAFATIPGTTLTEEMP